MTDIQEAHIKNIITRIEEEQQNHIKNVVALREELLLCSLWFSDYWELYGYMKSISTSLEDFSINMQEVRKVRQCYS